MIDLQSIVGFDWDDGNTYKSSDKHQVNGLEAESVFANEPLIVIDDATHSATEQRFNALGKTKDGRRLHVTFTLRQNNSLIRIISARTMNRNERRIYDEET